MINELLKKEYFEILSEVNSQEYGFENDKYSGVFLPIHFDAYLESNPRIMIVGRETAGWNTNNNKNTLYRITEKNKNNLLNEIIDESIERYSWHLRKSQNGPIKTKHKSHFQRYYFNVSKALDLRPDGMIYANLFAWDYNKKSPLERPDEELSKITDISLRLLSAQIKLFKPEYIIFATGYRNVDPIIKSLFKKHFKGHKSVRINPKKLWEFRAAEATCFRIAHPRAQHGHAVYRKEVIDKIKDYLKI